MQGAFKRIEVNPWLRNHLQARAVQERHFGQLARDSGLLSAPWLPDHS